MNEWDIPFRTIRQSILEVAKEREIRTKTLNKMYQSEKIDMFFRRLMICGTSKGVKVASTQSAPRIFDLKGSSADNMKKVAFVA